MSSWLPSHREVSLAGLAIEGWKNLGFEICISSHSPIPSSLQKSCKYSIYTDENCLTSYSEEVQIGTFYHDDTFKYKTNKGNTAGSHSIPILYNLYNALLFVKGKGYTNFILADNDIVFDFKDGAKFIEHLFESNFEILDLFGYRENSSCIVSNLFAGKISSWLKIFDKLQMDNLETARKNYLEICWPYPLLENFIHYALTEGWFTKYKIYPSPIRDYFTSKWQGSQEGGIVDFPLFNITNISATPEIVKVVGNEQEFCLVVKNQGKFSKEGKIEVYGDGELIAKNNEYHFGGVFWWMLNNSYDHYQVKLFYKDKIITTWERSRNEILNGYSQIEFNNKN